MKPNLARAASCLLLAVALAACVGGRTLSSGAPAEDVATPPRLLNGEEVTEAVQREYPSNLRDQGVTGLVRLRLLVGTDGVPVEVAILDSSGIPELDRAATRVASVLRFEPATDVEGRPLRVWASYPIAFR